jgi:hypothetical protein
LDVLVDAALDLDVSTDASNDSLGWGYFNLRLDLFGLGFVLSIQCYCL